MVYRGLRPGYHSRGVMVDECLEASSSVLVELDFTQAIGT